MKKIFINVKGCTIVKSQELNPEGSQSSGFQDISRGKSFHFVAPLVELGCQCS